MKTRWWFDVGKMMAVLFAILFVATAAKADVFLRQTGNSNPNGHGVYQSGESLTGGGSFLPFIFTNNTGTALQLDHGQMGVSAYTQWGLLTGDLYANAWTPAG